MVKYARQKRYRENLEAKGFKRVALWVPAGVVDQLKAYAAQLAANHTGSAPRSPDEVDLFEGEVDGRH